MSLEEFRSAFTKDHVMSGDVAVTTGSFHKIGEYKVEAGEMVSLGYGQNETQEGAPGRIYIDLKDDANAEMNGLLRFAAHSPQGRPLKIMAEYRTETLRTDLSNRTLQVPFPSTNFPYLSEDKKLVVEFLPDASGTVSKANSKIIFDITNAVV